MWGFVKGFGKTVIGVLLILQLVVGLALLLLVVGVVTNIGGQISGDGQAAKLAVPQDAALHLNPKGVLVEEAEDVDPFEQAVAAAYGANEPQQIEAGDVVRVLRAAAKDKRIKMVVLDLGELYIPATSASKLYAVG